LFVVGSIVAGLAQNPATLITARVIQGLGGGGLSALAQVVLAAMISPRERGRYSGYLGATFAVATVGGPLLGGVITDTAWLGWRWCLFVGVPFAVVALIVLQRTLNLPLTRHQVKVDWAGAFFITAAVCTLLIWVTFAGDKYDWLSWQTYALVGAAIALALAFLFVETKANEPIIPLRLFRNPTITLASIASLFVGIALFAGTVFLGQYFQLARGESPTMSGVMTIPLIAGLFVSSTSSTVTFFRSLGGAVGVSVLGSILTTRIGHHALATITQLSSQDQATATKASGGGQLPDLAMLPAPVRTWLEGAYGHGIGDSFLYVAPIALIAFLVTLFIKEVPLRASSGLAQAAEADRKP
jgi:MFS family permease